MATGAFSAEAYATGILAGDRVMLGRAITLIESTRADHQELARRTIDRCLPHTGNAFRIGITGAPGVGKSTFIDVLGMRFIETGKQVAVLAIDPSSAKTSGSILGDKTRMARLASHPMAFIRPSPNTGTLGGIARSTREAMLLCEAAGFDVVFIETVGVGQSEFSVHDLVDALLLLLITGAGDDLQGIKRGIMEMADLIVVHKAEGSNAQPAEALKRTIKQAVHMLPAPRSGWESRVLSASSIDAHGMDDVHASLLEFEAVVRASGEFNVNRGRQALAWMHRYVADALKRRFEEDDGVKQLMPFLEASVLAGTLSPIEAAARLMERSKEE